MTEPTADTPLSRREALRIAAGFVSAVAGIACRASPRAESDRGAPGRLLARPAPPTLAPIPGLTPLSLDDARDGMLYVPPTYRNEVPTPLVLMLHGAGQSAQIGIRPFLPLADAARVILLAPDSRTQTWDFLYGPYGADVTFIDRALAFVFRRCRIDASRIFVEGFSDGASYALSLGLTNGDFFSRIVAFSACILAPAAYAGHPRIFLTHGTDDPILPLDRCGRRLSAQLKAKGYDVDYREFPGRHGVPPELARAAMDWLTS